MLKQMMVLLFVCSPLVGLAQNNEADINIFLGSPQGEFRDNLDRTAVGINGSVAFGLPNTPVQFGVELGIMTYGSDRRSESFNPNIPEVQVEVRTDYDILTGHFFTRLERPTGIVRPYIDGLIGLNYLFTESRVRDEDDAGPDIASTTNFDDTAFSYGIGGGIKFKVYQNPKNVYLINLKSRYLIGGDANYLQPGSIEVIEGNLSFDESRSNTNLLTIHLGMAFKF